MQDLLFIFPQLQHLTTEVLGALHSMLGGQGPNAVPHEDQAEPSWIQVTRIRRRQRTARPYEIAPAAPVPPEQAHEPAKGANEVIEQGAQVDPGSFR
jgi:hypothetical protein